MHLRLRQYPTAFFALCAATVVTICITVLRSGIFTLHPDMAAWGVTFDLTITIPAIYYFVVVRAGNARPLTMAPVFAIAVSLAALVVPRGEQQFLHQLHWLSAPLDLVTVTMIGSRLLRMRRTRGESAGSDDVAVRIEQVTNELLGGRAIGRLVAGEVTVMYYALFCWRKKDAPGVTVHQRNGWGTIVACLMVLVTAESIGLHLLLHLWSAKAAWIATALDAWAILWLLGDYHALRLRPSFREGNTIHLRYGLRWSVDIALDEIESIEPIAGEAQWKRKDVLKMAMFDEPRILLSLRQPHIANGMAGLRKRITAVAILPDDEQEFGKMVG